MVVFFSIDLVPAMTLCGWPGVSGILSQSVYKVGRRSPGLPSARSIRCVSFAYRD